MGSSKDDLVNIGELIEDYVWNCYKSRKGFFKRRLLLRKNYYFDIRWGYVDFKHDAKPDKEHVSQTSTGDKNDTYEATTDIDVSGIERQRDDIVSKADKAKKKNIELYFSEYENETDIPQRYKFTASRATTSSTKFELQESYTLGAETNLEINLVDIIKIGAKVSGSFSVTETKGEEFSKTLTWNIDTDIEVPSWHKVKASLYVYEIVTKTNFVLKTTISLPTARLPVTIRKVKNDKGVHTEVISNLKALFYDVPKRLYEIVGKEVNGYIENEIVLTTRGVCRNVSFMNQHVKVECKEIEGAPQSTTNKSQKERVHSEKSPDADVNESNMDVQKSVSGDKDQVKRSMILESAGADGGESKNDVQKLVTDDKNQVNNSASLESTASDGSESLKEVQKFVADDKNNGENVADQNPRLEKEVWRLGDKNSISLKSPGADETEPEVEADDKNHIKTVMPPESSEGEYQA